jgi:hypothetical protein
MTTFASGGPVSIQGPWRTIGTAVRLQASKTELQLVKGQDLKFSDGGQILGTDTVKNITLGDVSTIIDVVIVAPSNRDVLLTAGEVKLRASTGVVLLETDSTSLAVEVRGTGGLRIFSNGTHNIETLAGDRTLLLTDAHWQRLDPGGALRNVTLPAVTEGLWFHLTNEPSSGFNLVVKNPATATLVTLGEGESCFAVCNASAWAIFGHAAAG